MVNVCAVLPGVKLVVYTTLVATVALLLWNARVTVHPDGLPVIPVPVMVSVPTPLNVGRRAVPVCVTVAGAAVKRLTPLCDV